MDHSAERLLLNGGWRSATGGLAAGTRSASLAGIRAGSALIGLVSHEPESSRALGWRGPLPRYGAGTALWSSVSGR